MQAIVLHLIFQDLAARDIDKFSPWIDVRRRPLDEVIANIEAQTHRRVFKSHVPLDGLPFFREVKYIVVGRDPRDVFMSLWNHYSNYTEENFASVNNPDGRVGPPLPPCPESIRDFWLNWIAKGWFDVGHARAIPSGRTSAMSRAGGIIATCQTSSSSTTTTCSPTFREKSRGSPRISTLTRHPNW